MDLREVRGAALFAFDGWARLGRRLRAAVANVGGREGTESLGGLLMVTLFLLIELLLNRLDIPFSSHLVGAELSGGRPETVPPFRGKGN